jgi:hypothetical protein
MGGRTYGQRLSLINGKFMGSSAFWRRGSEQESFCLRLILQRIAMLHKPFAVSGLLKAFAILAVVLLWQWVSASKGQAQVLRDESNDVIQYSGLVMTTDSFVPLPYATVLVKGTNRGAITTETGFFTLPVYRRDTLVIRSVGYKQVELSVPDTLQANRHRVVVKLPADTIQLDEVVVYPWPTKEEFKQAFVNLDLPEDDVERARKNLNRRVMLAINQEMKMDAGENYNFMMQQQARSFRYAGNQRNYMMLGGGASSGTAIPTSLLNPFNWAKFFKSLRRGDFKKGSGEDDFRPY